MMNAERSVRTRISVRKNGGEAVRKIMMEWTSPRRIFTSQTGSSIGMTRPEDIVRELFLRRSWQLGMVK